MEHGHTGGDPFVGVQAHHARKQVQAQHVQVLRVVAQRDTFPFRKCRLEVRKLQSVRPVTLVGSSENFEYLEDLVDLGVAHEQGSFLGHFSENATKTPHVNA